MALSLARQMDLPAEILRRQAELEGLHPGRVAAPPSAATRGPDDLEALLRACAKDGKVHRLTLQDHPPACLSRTSVLYTICCDEVYYVGETDDIIRRHRSHADRLKRRGSMWAVATRHKSESRKHEARIIGVCKSWGWLLESDHDGNHEQFGAS